MQNIFFGVSDGELALNSITAVAEGTVFDICVTLTSSGSHLGFDVNVTINTLDGKAGKYILFTTFLHRMDACNLGHKHCCIFYKLEQKTLLVDSSSHLFPPEYLCLLWSAQP